MSYEILHILCALLVCSLLVATATCALLVFVALLLLLHVLWWFIALLLLLPGPCCWNVCQPQLVAAICLVSILGAIVLAWCRGSDLLKCIFLV